MLLPRNDVFRIQNDQIKMNKFALATVAQSVEQLIRNQQVRSSSLRSSLVNSLWWAISRTYDLSEGFRLPQAHGTIESERFVNDGEEVD